MKKKKKTEGNPALLSAIAGVTVLTGNPPNGVTWSKDRITIVQATSMLGRICRKTLKSVEGIGLLKKTKLDNARELKGTYYNDLDDIELKDTMQKARAKSWKCQWNPRCLETLLIGTETTAAHKIILEKQDMHVSLKPSTRRGRALGRLSAEITMHKPIPTLQAMRIPDAKADVNKPIMRYA